MKKLTTADLKAFRDRLYLPISDAALEADLPPYYHPARKSDEISYMKERRAALVGSCPSGSCAPSRSSCGRRRLRRAARRVGQAAGRDHDGDRAPVQDLIKDKEIGARFVPIIPDEARTFGLDAIFPTAKIYSPQGQQYDAVGPATCCCRTRSRRPGRSCTRASAKRARRRP